MADGDEIPWRSGGIVSVLNGHRGEKQLGVDGQNEMMEVVSCRGLQRVLVGRSWRRRTFLETRFNH